MLVIENESQKILAEYAENFVKMRFKKEKLMRLSEDDIWVLALKFNASTCWEEIVAHNKSEDFIKNFFHNNAIIAKVCGVHVPFISSDKFSAEYLVGTEPHYHTNKEIKKMLTEQPSDFNRLLKLIKLVEKAIDKGEYSAPQIRAFAMRYYIIMDARTEYKNGHK